ncbi:MAG TPA: sialidase family protein [Actinomycetota bacterium]
MKTARPLVASLSLVLVFLSPVGNLRAQEPDCGGPPVMPPLTFDQPKVFDTVRAGGEPSIDVHPDGTLLYAAHASTTLFYRSNMPDPDYATPYTGSTYVWRSTDGGNTWRYVGLGGTEVGPHAATISGFSDPDFAFDSAGNAYTAGINLANVYVAKSSDSGKTWSGHAFAALATDREWLAADQPDVVYMNGNSLVQGRRLWKSEDGGLTWDAGRALDGGGPPNKIELDKSDGRLYFANASGGVQVFPNIRNNDFTNFVADVPGGTPHAHGFLNNMALDRAGNAYLVSNTATSIRVSYSTDRGATWTSQTIHTSPANTVLWPWISAGDDGRVGVSWFQADKVVGSTDGTAANYRVMAAQTTTGHGWTDECGVSHEPAYEVTVATPQPFHSGTICSQGTTCQIGGIDRRLGDYHSNAITPDGTFLIAYSDTSVKPTGAVSHPGFIRQSGGLDFVDDGPRPTEITSLEGTPDGGNLSVSGAVDFGGEAPVTIAEDVAGDGPIEPQRAAEDGVDLTAARLYQPDPDKPELVFEWKATNLPSLGSHPEAVRYTFPFKIGTKRFQPQAKLTNFASITLVDDAPSHARLPGDHFQLRGNCVDNYPIPEAPLANCPHVAWVGGEFLPGSSTIRLFLPIGASFAPEIVPGAVITRDVVATTTIVAAYQAVVSNATTSDEALWEEGVTYTVPRKTSALGVAPAGTDPSTVTFGAPATVGSDNVFGGSVDVSALAPGDYELFAKACFASNCAVASTPFTI